MEDLKQKFSNAGFTMTSKGYFLKEHNLVDLFVGVNEDLYYFSASVEGEMVVNCYKFETLEELNKLCYGYLLENLDFEPKKTYQWKEHFDQSPTVEHNGFLSLMQGLNAIVSIPAAQKLSIIAGLKLRVIVNDINADFESIDGCMYYPSEFNGEIIYCNSQGKKNNIGCQSKEGFEKLLETNLSLLNDYFGIKTETT